MADGLLECTKTVHSGGKEASVTDVFTELILIARSEYCLILSRRRRRPSWLNSGIFSKIERYNLFIIQHIDNKVYFTQSFTQRKQNGKTAIFLPDTRNYVHRRIPAEYTRRISTAT